MNRGRRRGEAGQALPVVLGLVTLLFLLGSALAAHASTALRTTAAGKAQADDLYAADGGLELGIWWQRAGRAGSPPVQTLNGRTVTTTVSLGAPRPCPTVTPIRLTGFEHGAVSTAGGGLFATVSGATVDAATARTGRYSLQVADTSASTARSASWTLSASPLVARLAIRLASLPSASVAELATLGATTGGNIRLGYSGPSGRFVVQVGTGPAVTSTSMVTAGTWHVVDVVVSGNPRAVDWQVDGLAQGQATSSEPGAAGSTTVRLGSTVASDRFTANYDDVVLSSTAADYPIAADGILPLRPDGAGIHSGAGDLANDDGTPIDATSPGRLADDPMTSETSGVLQRAQGSTSYVEVTFADSTASCVSAAGGVVAFRASNSSVDDGSTLIVVDGTPQVLYSGDMARTQLQYRSAVLAPPGAAWTVSAVNGLRARVGLSSDILPEPRWEALLVEYATARRPPSTVTIAASAGDATVTATYLDAGPAAPALQTWTTTR